MKLSSLIIGIALSAAAFAAKSSQAVLSWTPPATFTNGGAISGAVTYNVYQGATGAETAVQTGLTATTATVTTGLTVGASVCFEVTAVVASVESARSAEVCKTITPPIPGAPTTIIITFTP